MHILIVRFSALGDLITLEPTFRAIRYFFPDATIDLLTSKIGYELYSDTGYFNEIYVHQTFKKTIIHFRKKCFSLIYNFHCNSLSHKLIFCLHYNKLINSAANWFQKLIGIKLPAKSLDSILKLSELDDSEIKKYCQDIDNLLIKMNYAQNDSLNKFFNRNTITISTGSSHKWLSKQWGTDNYNSLIQKLALLPINLILVGTISEQHDAEYITKNNPTIINLVNKTTLSDLKLILAKSILFIGNDSGPTHMAASVGTNTITIFGPTGEKYCVKHAPYKGYHECIIPKKAIKCHPCYKARCPTRKECMQSISVDDVYETVIKILNNKI